MQADAVNAGLKTVSDTFTTSPCSTVPNAACMTWLWMQGPYNNADPATRFFVGDVRRGWGQHSSGEWQAALKQQGAAEALLSAGITAPQLALQKDHLETYPSVQLAYGGAAPAAYYSTLGLNKYVRSGHAVSLVQASEAPSPYVPVMSFSNGTSLVRAPDVTGSGKGAGLSVSATVAPSCSASTQASADLGPYDISGQLNEDQETIPMNFFNVPMYRGDVANLDYSGANMLQAMQTGDFLKTTVASGDAAAVQGIGPDNFPYAYSREGSARGPVNPTAQGPLWLPGGPMYGEDFSKRYDADPMSQWDHRPVYEPASGPSPAPSPAPSPSPAPAPAQAPSPGSLASLASYPTSYAAASRGYGYGAGHGW